MDMKKKLLIIILILIGAIGVSAAFMIHQYEQPSTTNIMKGDHNILLLLADTDEKRPGIGAVDMAYTIHVLDGNIRNLTPIYPGGMKSDKIMEPAAAGSGKMKLNDALWYADTATDAANAQEIVQYNTGIKTDAVVILTPTAVDAMINSVGPIYVPGYGNVTHDSIDAIRNLTEEKNSTLSRGQGTDLLMKPILAAVKDPSKSPALFQAIVEQYLEGNIIVIPKDLFTQFAISKGLSAMLK